MVCKAEKQEIFEELMDRLGLKEPVDDQAKVNGVRWFGHVLRQEKDDALKKALVFEMDGLRRG